MLILNRHIEKNLHFNSILWEYSNEKNRKNLAVHKHDARVSYSPQISALVFIMSSLGMTAWFWCTSPEK